MPFEVEQRMARRSREWNADLARDLQRPEVARGFLLRAIEDGAPLRVALATTIRAVGVKEFAAKVRMETSNVQRAIDPQHNPRVRTLERLLNAFGLRLTASPMRPSSRRRSRAPTATTPTE